MDNREIFYIVLAIAMIILSKPAVWLAEQVGLLKLVRKEWSSQQAVRMAFVLFGFLVILYVIIRNYVEYSL